MKRYSYWGDFSLINFPLLVKEGWKNPKKEKPSVSSFQEVLIIKEKHGGDVDCIIAQWMPTDNYTNGHFQFPDGKKIESRIYLWRNLFFLPVENEI